MCETSKIEKEVMLKIIIWYLFFGVVFNFLVDISTDYAKSKGVKVPPETNWNWSTRIMSGIIWPIGLIFYLKGYINERYNNKK